MEAAQDKQQPELLTIDVIRARLIDRNLAAVHRATKVTQKRLAAIRSGDLSDNVRYIELLSLSEYLA